MNSIPNELNNSYGCESYATVKYPTLPLCAPTSRCPPGRQRRRTNRPSSCARAKRTSADPAALPQPTRHARSLALSAHKRLAGMN